LNILDIGCQNLYLAEASKIEEFILRWNPKVNIKNVSEYACMIEAGSAIDPVVGGLNGAWLGDLLTKAGHEYLSFDIFEGYKTQTFDLNRDSILKDQINKFDIVFNFGTSEHVIGQYNCFKIMHDAAKVGGLIYNEVPFTGYLDHGYFNYQPRFFYDLALANGYEIIDVAISDPTGFESMKERVIDVYEQRGISVSSRCGQWMNTSVPTSGIGVLYRKNHNASFKVGLEISTTVGAVKHNIKSFYERYSPLIGKDKKNKNIELTFDLVQQSMLNRLSDETLTHNEIMDFYRKFLNDFPGIDFPLELERKSLVLALDIWPERDDMKNRLTLVDELIINKFPVLSLVGELSLGDFRSYDMKELLH
jgi:hypothetical protein